MEFRIGDRVLFGRQNGEKTAGVIVKVNRKTVKVKTDESRGTNRARKAGTVWNVSKTLVQSDSESVEASPRLQEPVPVHARKSPRSPKLSTYQKALKAQEEMVAACSLKDAPKYIKDSMYYLDGHSTNKWGAEVDSRRQKLYKAEDGVSKGESFATVAECQAYLNKVTSSEWFTRRFGPLTVKVERTQGFRKSYCRGKGDAALIRILPVHQNERILLHELVHALIPSPHAGHGRLFCRVYAEVLRAQMGQKVYEDLVANFHLQGVKYSPHRTLKVAGRA